MIYNDPSNINTIRQLLEELKVNYLEKFKLEKVIIGADGKIYEMLVDLIANYGVQFKFVLPMLGNNSISY